ncbi:hypothetical protein BB560_003974 [Smittium megazygosporum]|uniref:phosphoinositide 5-phosphatase n=1 Tax=Smittium megazygosporum TaxID=133381 RepID=A0A2T9ZAH7_9FUNG|nr:hypothetical protein BB560_003974 [Smittium megazygosporum]
MQRFLVFTSETPRAIGIVPLYQEGLPDSEKNHQFLSISLESISNQKILVSIRLLDIYSNLDFFERLDIDPIYGIAGIIYDEQEVYLSLVSDADPIQNSVNEIFRVTKIRLLSLLTGDFDYNSTDFPYDQYSDSENEFYAPKVDNSYLGPYSMYNVKKKTSFYRNYNVRSFKLISYLEKANLYFSQTYDLTKSQQEQELDKLSNIFDPSSPESEQTNFWHLQRFKRNRFRWNNFMLESFIQFQRRMSFSEYTLFQKRKYILNLIQGYVGCYESYTRANYSDNAPISYMMISRLSASRIGARFLTRGIDDYGNVANSAETEVVVSSGNRWSLSYVIIRGSIPLFWTQQGIQIGSHKAELTRSIDASVPAAKRHFSELITHYGMVHIINLVKALAYEGTTVPKSFLNSIDSGNSFGELELGIAYDVLTKKLNLHELIGFTAFDYHQKVKGGQFDNISSLMNCIAPVMNRQRIFMKKMNSDGLFSVESWQYGVFRVNCLDCLDRTNVVQSEIAVAVLYTTLFERFSAEMQLNAGEINSVLRQLFVESGNALSKLYTGTSALKTTVTSTGKSGLSGFLSDASKTIGRFVQSSFNDKNKQDIIDTVVGNKQESSQSRRFFYYDPNFDEFKKCLSARMAKSTRTENIRFFSTTFNAGGQGCSNRGMESWFGDAIRTKANVIMISMQEVVNLSVSSVISADTKNRIVWTDMILRFLNASRDPSFDEYVLVASEQLAGFTFDRRCRRADKKRESS